MKKLGRAECSPFFSLKAAGRSSGKNFVRTTKRFIEDGLNILSSKSRFCIVGKMFLSNEEPCLSALYQENF